MNPNRSLSVLALTAAILAGGILLTAASVLPQASGQPPGPASDEVQAELSAALERRLQADQGTKPLTFDLFTAELDTAFTSPDGETAVLWLALRDDTGRRLASEPGLALARRSDGGWQVMLPGDPGWEGTLSNLPAEMLPQELGPAPDEALPAPNAPSAPLYGYYLPYAAGTSHWLEGSISHFQYIPELGYPSCSIEYCRYAYDFTGDESYPLLAAKSGTVYAQRDSCPDHSTTCTNYIVLYNGSEGTYQIYLHHAQGTIPDKLTPGTTVQRGQYIGDSDDTGYSTSQHVHFMVTNSVWVGSSGYYWGYSIDVRFADVPINNGIPRTCYEVTHFSIYDGASECMGDKSDPHNPANDWFVSGNVGAYPPTGGLTRPASGAVVTSGNNPLMDVTTAAADDVGIAYVQLTAKLDGQWVPIGPQVTQPIQPGVYDWDVNLCQAAPVNGPLDVAVNIRDYEGNLVEALDPRTIQVDHACPPPASQLQPAQTFDSTAVRLTWTAAVSGAGLDSFELQWRTEPGTWNPANIISYPGGARSAWFVGQMGGSYAFRLRALDANGQPEPWPAGDAAETSAILPAQCSPDGFEPDDTFVQANDLPLDVTVQANLCGPDDPDWFRVNFTDAVDHFIIARSISGGAAVKFTLYAGDGITPIVDAQAPGLGEPIVLLFDVPAQGTYSIKIEPLLPDLAGTQVVYSLAVTEAKKTYLPVISR